MGLNATLRRRWLGVLVLVAAVALLAAGQTLLEGRLTGLGFLVYWMACFALTGVAVFIAVWDARAVARETLKEHRAILNDAIRELRKDSQPKRPPPGQPLSPDQGTHPSTD